MFPNQAGFNLGVDPRKPGQNMRGFISLPHGSGKKVRIAVLTKGDKVGRFLTDRCLSDLTGLDLVVPLCFLTGGRGKSSGGRYSWGRGPHSAGISVDTLMWLLHCIFFFQCCRSIYLLGLQIQAGTIEFDRLIATPDCMAMAARVAKVLGYAVVNAGFPLNCRFIR